MVESRIRQELAEFLSAQKVDGWPNNDHFVHEGRGPLLRQLELSGGAMRWMSEFALKADLPASHPTPGSASAENSQQAPEAGHIPNHVS